MKIMKWLKEEFTKTPGYMRVNLLLLTTLAISSVTSTSLLIRQQVRSTSAENISYRNENPEAANEKLLANRIGRNIMDRPPNSKPTYPNLERPIFPERSCLSIQLWGKPTMRKPDNCLLTTF